MVQRLAIIGFVIAVIVAIFAFVQQRQAVEQVRTASTAQAVAESEQGTAIAMADDASNAQVQAEEERDVAVEQAEAAGTAGAEAGATADAAIDQANLSGTAQAAGAATSAVQLTAAVGTAQAEADNHATTQAQSESDLATANALIEADATQEAVFLAALSTATAQVDLASFAVLAAESDRSEALADSYAAATQIAGLENELATAQFQVEGQPPRPTLVPSSTSAIEPTVPPRDETPIPEVVPGELNETFTSGNGIITFDYPTGWLAGETEQGFIVIVSSQDVLTRAQPELLPGQVEINVYFSSGSSLTGDESGATLEDVTATLLTSLTEGEDSPFSFGAVSEGTIAGHPSTRAAGTESVNDTSLIVMDMGNDVFAISLAVMSRGEIDTVEPVIVSILETLELNL